MYLCGRWVKLALRFGVIHSLYSGGGCSFVKSGWRIDCRGRASRDCYTVYYLKWAATSI